MTRYRGLNCHQVNG